MNPTPPNINTSTKSINVMQKTNPSLITRSPYPAIQLLRIQIFKTDFRKLSILSKFWEWRIWQGMGVGFASLWCIAYKNRYAVHPLSNDHYPAIQKIKSWFKLIFFWNFLFFENLYFFEIRNSQEPKMILFVFGKIDTKTKQLESYIQKRLNDWPLPLNPFIKYLTLNP